MNCGVTCSRVNIPGQAAARTMAGMERPFLQRLHVRGPRGYALAAIVFVLSALTAWAAWSPGSPSTFTLAWVAVVSVGLIVAVVLAIRDGSPTQSVAHVLYNAEHPGNPTGDAAGRAAVARK